MLGINADKYDMPDNSRPDAISPKYSNFIADLDLNSSARASRMSSRTGTSGDDVEHDIAVATYYAIFEMNSDVATDLLTSYRTIDQVAGDVTAAMEGPFNGIGLTDNSPIARVNVTSTSNGSEPNNHGNKFISIDFISTWIRFLLSLDAIPYYMVALTTLIIFVTFRILLRRR
jgi:hypothetical protein